MFLKDKRKVNEKKRYSLYQPISTTKHLSQNKSKNKYKTPNKSINTTTHTRNCSFFMNTNTIKASTYVKEMRRDRSQSTKHQKYSLSSKKSEKQKSKNKKNIPKSYQTQSRNYLESKSKQDEKIYQKSNIDFYKSLRFQKNSEVTSQYLSKISKIFDLVVSNTPLTADLQFLIQEPIINLRQKIKYNAKHQIAKVLMQFKAQCMQVFRTAPGKHIIPFLRASLPENNIWNPSRKNSTRSNDNQKVSRSNYFQSLRKKDTSFENEQNEVLCKIENRLNEFLEKSLKQRRVYI